MINSLKIGPLHYEVREVNDLHDVSEDGRKRWLHGHIVYSDTVIEVGADQSDDRKICTLWHEAIHGILDNAGYTEHPESMVIALGFGLVDLVRNNPALIQLTVGEKPEVRTLMMSLDGVSLSNGNQLPTEHP